MDLITTKKTTVNSAVIGIVIIQEVKIFLITRRSIAPIPRAKPTPNIPPTKV